MSPELKICGFAKAFRVVNYRFNDLDGFSACSSMWEDAEAISISAR